MSRMVFAKNKIYAERARINIRRAHFTSPHLSLELPASP